MTTEERLRIIESLIPYLQTYYAAETVKMDYDVRQELKRVYGDIYNVYNLDVSCSTCVVHYLNMLHSWYDTNKPTPKEKRNGRKS